MKKNTCGCGGGHDHKHCPPLKSGKTAKTRGHFCKVKDVLNAGEEEVTMVLGDVNLTIMVESDICLPTPAQDIKAIRKNIHLTQCKAIPVPPAPAGFAQEEEPAGVNLFIEGYVHKNIQYSEGPEGVVRDFSINVPFSCFQPVNDELFEIEPPADLLFSQKNNQVQEIRELDKDGMGSNRCSFGSVTFEQFNEPIKCKLVKQKITEFDFPKNFDNWGNFKEITEKMTIDLTVRLTQKQVAVELPEPPDAEECRPRRRY
jgi:hypothetical protein